MEKMLRDLNKVLIIALVISLLMLFAQVFLSFKSSQVSKEYKAKSDSLQLKVDSLYAELYPSQIELSRYENAYRIFLERNPKGAEEYGNIISNETE